jgi:hypothetical protein
MMMPVEEAEVLATANAVAVETEKTDTSHLRISQISIAAVVKILGDTKVKERMMVEVAPMEAGAVAVVVMKGPVKSMEKVTIEMEVRDMVEEIVMAILDLAEATNQEILTEVVIVEEEMKVDSLGAESVISVIKKGILQESVQKLVNKIRGAEVVVDMEGRVGEMTVARGEVVAMLARLETNGEVKCEI